MRWKALGTQLGVQGELVARAASNCTQKICWCKFVVAITPVGVLLLVYKADTPRAGKRPRGLVNATAQQKV